MYRCNNNEKIDHKFERKEENLEGGSRGNDYIIISKKEII